MKITSFKYLLDNSLNSFFIFINLLILFQIISFGSNSFLHICFGYKFNLIRVISVSALLINIFCSSGKIPIPIIVIGEI